MVGRLQDKVSVLTEDTEATGLSQALEDSLVDLSAPVPSSHNSEPTSCRVPLFAFKAFSMKPELCLGDTGLYHQLWFTRGQPHHKEVHCWWNTPSPIHTTLLLIFNWGSRRRAGFAFLSTLSRPVFSTNRKWFSPGNCRNLKYLGIFGLKIGFPDSHDDVFALALFKVAQAWVSTYQYCFEFETRNSVEELPTWTPDPRLKYIGSERWATTIWMKKWKNNYYN